MAALAIAHRGTRPVAHVKVDGWTRGGNGTVLYLVRVWHPSSEVRDTGRRRAWICGDGRRFILNALQVIRCIDDVRSEEVFYWQPEDGEPDRVGQYRNVRGMKVAQTSHGEEGITGTDFIEV